MTGGDRGAPFVGLDLVTEHQLAIVLAANDLFVMACPGSGKTRATAVRVVRLLSEGKRVAATSYTNVGVQQLRKVTSSEAGHVIPGHSFMGTLHAFLLRYVFYPFGHLVMGCTVRPRLLASDDAWQDVVFHGDQRIRAPLSRFFFAPTGALAFRGALPKGIGSREEAAALGQGQARELKLKAAKLGLASSDDCMYWSLQVLQRFPDISEAVAMRFDEIVVDEAQDTSAVQLECLRSLKMSGGLTSLVLVGDLEQSIFSFQGADPRACKDLAQAAALAAIELTENHRSSQVICDTAAKFRGRRSPDTAVGEHATCTWAPEVILYEPGNPAAAVLHFERRLEALGIPSEDSAVLARNNDLVADLNAGRESGGIRPWVRVLGQATYASRTGATLTRREMEAVDRLIGYAAWGKHELVDLDSAQRRQVREAAMQLLEDAPDLSLPLDTWIQQARAVLSVCVQAIETSPYRAAGHLLQRSSGDATKPASQVFGSRRSGLRAQTIHDIKGESRDAVLLVASEKATSSRVSQATAWSLPLRETQFEPDEELRLVFVALTRARRFCSIALPSNTEVSVLDAFQRSGFLLNRAGGLTL